MVLGKNAPTAGFIRRRGGLRSSSHPFGGWRSGCQRCCTRASCELEMSIQPNWGFAVGSPLSTKPAHGVSWRQPDRSWSPRTVGCDGSGRKRICVAAYRASQRRLLPWEVGGCEKKNSSSATERPFAQRQTGLACEAEDTAGRGRLTGEQPTSPEIQGCEGERTRVREQVGPAVETQGRMEGTSFVQGKKKNETKI